MSRPVAAGLDFQHGAFAVEAGLEAVQGVGLAERLADHGEVARAPPRHGAENRLDGVEGVRRGQQGLDVMLGYDDHGLRTRHAQGANGARRMPSGSGFSAIGCTASIASGDSTTGRRSSSVSMSIS